MFQLEKEIHAWGQSIHALGLRSAASIEELEDYLYSETGRLLEEGLSEEEAFFAARKQVGKAEDLVTEYSKNRDFMSRFCFGPDEHSMIDYKKRSEIMKTKRSKLGLVHAILYAAVMFFAAYVLRDTEHYQTISFLIILLWFASSKLIREDQRSIKSDTTILPHN